MHSLKRIISGLAVIIPTKNKPANLRKFLDSLNAQSVLPETVVVSDGSDLPENAGSFSGLDLGFELAFVAVPCGYLTKQRNTALKHLKSNIRFVCFFDDDILLAENALYEMAEFWKNAGKDIAGAAFNIINSSLPARGRLFRKIFGMSSEDRGVILPSGYNTEFCPVSENMRVNWLFGGATVWRREIFREFSFDENIKGYGLGEDTDFSYRVGKKYGLVAVKNARVKHLSNSLASENGYRIGKAQVVNRYYFVKKNPELSKPLCLWSGIGMLAYNIYQFIRQGKTVYFKRGLGNLSGLIKIIVGL